VTFDAHRQAPLTKHIPAERIPTHLGQFGLASVVDLSESTPNVPRRRPPAELPHHLNRYIKNDANVPPGYFSILQETGLSQFGPLHNLGFEIPKGWVPDISVGKLFCAWLRAEHAIDTNVLPTYKHDYLDGRVVDPKLYPDEFLAEYRRWFRTVWLPEYGVRYFKAKSLAYLDKLPALASPTKVANLPNFKVKA